MYMVAPLVGAWIEIYVQIYAKAEYRVAPLVGAWIEIVTQKCINCEKIVAPLVGAWIEIIKAMSSLGAPPSLLSWERGLKYY